MYFTEHKSCESELNWLLKTGNYKLNVFIGILPLGFLYHQLLTKTTQTIVIIPYNNLSTLNTFKEMISILSL